MLNRIQSCCISAIFKKILFPILEPLLTVYKSVTQTRSKIKAKGGTLVNFESNFLSCSNVTPCGVCRECAISHVMTMTLRPRLWPRPIFVTIQIDGGHVLSGQGCCIIHQRDGYILCELCHKFALTLQIITDQCCGHFFAANTFVGRPSK